MFKNGETYIKFRKKYTIHIFKKPLHSVIYKSFTWKAEDYVIRYAAYRHEELIL